MKNNLQRKIAQYKQEKSKKGILQNLISQKRKNLEKLISEESTTPIQKENEFRIENYAKQIDFAQQKYFDDMEQLQNIKFKIIELKGVYETLQLEISLQEDNLSSCMQSFKRQLVANQEIIEKTRVRMSNQKEQKLKMFEERCNVHVQQIDKLTDEKQKFINFSGDLVEKLKGLDFKFKQLKDKFQERFKREKQNWVKAQQERREKWQQKKFQQISQNTLRGLEPAIQKIVNNSKKQIFEIQQKYQSLRNQYKSEMNQQYQKNLQFIKKIALSKIQQEKNYYIQNSDKHYRELIQKLRLAQQAQITRIKVAKEAQIRELQDRRKKQTQYFMVKNKDFLMSHLNQIKQIKSSYERQIKQLDTSVDKLLQKQEKLIREKYQQKTQSYRQQKRKQLQQKLKAFHMKQRQQSETLYEDLVQNVACQNQVFETQLKIQTEKKIKQFKQNNQSQMKNLRKTQQSILNKQNLEKEAISKFLQVRNSIELQYNQLLHQCQYLKKKQIQFQSEVMSLKTKQGDSVKSEAQQLQNIAKHWQEQNEILMKKISQIQTQIQTQQKVMKQKNDEEKTKYTGLLNSLDKNSLQILKKMNEEIERSRKQKQMKIVLNKKLIETKKKMKELQLKRKSQYKI